MQQKVLYSFTTLFKICSIYAQHIFQHTVMLMINEKQKTIHRQKKRPRCITPQTKQHFSKHSRLQEIRTAQNLNSRFPILLWPSPRRSHVSFFILSTLTWETVLQYFAFHSQPSFSDFQAEFVLICQ